MATRLLLIVLASLLMSWLSGCTYNHKPFEVAASASSDDFVIQIDDYGQFWDSSAPIRALNRIDELSKTTNVIVLLFVHGWHHDAAPDDENLRDFALSVADTRKRLIDRSNPESRVYRESRKSLTDTEALSVVSIYVGWRGRSLPGVLDYTTFWGRKAAAERVGEGDLRQFLGQLNALYRESRVRRTNGSTRKFFGLVSFGHSFGGQVLFRSVAFEIERELLAMTGGAMKANGVQKQVVDLLGFGDLVVLVNPAFEALQFERIWRLSRELEFGQKQNPIMLVVSSAGDIPRQVLFPAGRNLDAFFLRPDFRPGQRALWTEALGEYKPFRTHSVDVTLNSSQLTPGFDPGVYTRDPCAIANLDLTNNLSIAGVRLTPAEGYQPNSPFLVAHASKDVVLNHSKVFEEVLRKFLNDYVAIAEGKRMVTADTALICR